LPDIYIQNNLTKLKILKDLFMKNGATMKSAITIISLGLLCGTAAYAADSQTTTTTSSAPADKSVAAGVAFLDANKGKPGVVVLPDGLQYKVVKEGSGAKPEDTDMVTVNYAGTLVDGTEFDSSYKRGEPATFPVNGVIPGWTEALKLMKPGATWMLFIPASLAYGDAGAPPAIGPNQTLIFKVELLKVQKNT
jgi:FKBP-type peptidyl-prolyl cis-trans isomerase